MNRPNPHEWGGDYYAVITNLVEPNGFKINWRGTIEYLVLQIRQLDAGRMLLILPDVPQEAPPDFANMIRFKFETIGWWNSPRKAYVKIYAKRRIRIPATGGRRDEFIDLKQVKEGGQYYPDWRHR